MYQIICFLRVHESAAFVNNPIKYKLRTDFSWYLSKPIWIRCHGNISKCSPNAGLLRILKGFLLNKTDNTLLNHAV